MAGFSVDSNRQSTLTDILKSDSETKLGGAVFDIDNTGGGIWANPWLWLTVVALVAAVVIARK